MQYSKAKPSVGIKVSVDAYERIKKVSYDQHIPLKEALEILLSSGNNERVEKLQQINAVEEEKVELLVNFVNKMGKLLKSKQLTAKAWRTEIVEANSQTAKLDATIDQLLQSLK